MKRKDNVVLYFALIALLVLTAAAKADRIGGALHSALPTTIVR